MTCISCGRPGLRKLGQDCFRASYMPNARRPLAQITELLCWTCLVWVRTGKVPPERRH